MLSCSLFDPQFFEEVDAQAKLLENKELHENCREVVLMVSIHGNKVDDSDTVNNDRGQKQIPGVSVKLLLHVDVPNFLWLFTRLSVSVERFFFFIRLLFNIIVVELDVVMRLVVVSIGLIQSMMLMHGNFILFKQFFLTVSELLESLGLHFSHERLKREHFDDI